jgi:pimeloyl-ACP methyl ester carboxylesterase
MSKHTIYKSKEGKEKIHSLYENYLQELEVERVYVDTTLGKTHVLVAGPREGKPVFIFQGGNCINPMTLSWFKPLFSDYRIYAPDTIGHPGFSDENRISASDDSFARWTVELMNHFRVERSAFIGPSYGAGIILRLAAFMPKKIACSILIAPAGIKLGSKVEMIRKILVPLLLFKMNGSAKQMNRIADTMSDYSMKEMDRDIIASIFKNVKLESEMPKFTEKSELVNYYSPTMVIAGKKDVFFPDERIQKTAKEIIPNLTKYQTYDMGHIPSEEFLAKINKEIEDFLHLHY